jgi:hypothetical protein
LLARLDNQGMTSTSKVGNSKDRLGRRRSKRNAAEKSRFTFSIWTTSNRNLILPLLGCRIESSGSIVLEIKIPHSNDDVGVLWSPIVVDKRVQASTPRIVGIE